MSQLRIPPHAPYAKYPFDYYETINKRVRDQSVIAAIKQLAKGEARPDQQKLALEFIIQDLAWTYELSYRPNHDGGDRDTAMGEGRRYVGLELLKIINTPAEKLLGGKPTAREHD